RWLQISLTDGSVRDEISLTDEVFGGPDVVSTLGSGTFQRVDGRWQPLGDLFVTAVSNSSVLGRRCDSPEQCRTVLVDRRTGTEVVPDPRLGDLSDVVLIRESSRPLAITGGGLVDLTGGTTAAIPGFVTDGPVAVEGSTVAGVRELSVAAGTGTLAIVDIDRGRSSTLAVDLVPRWLVILPPG
ncbi:MAG: hypothetical protein OER95_12725, partial [Acidimicrobiia bacterium]|nr:hypothetical protein [Acidimicrobiia bacterium]